ncbi:unnamed protein product [Leptidea sinapis]|uniref:PNT domain-containing protein n=2 Tax=Leptidea sinapis TaxID=189913 RepID=A0A5E4PYW8_9NEOP|nr:unnamed protein product [Leptidea sinapis]
MIDYARPYDANISEFYQLPNSPAPARLDDFQVFKKNHITYTYGSYYNTYDVLAEPEVEATANVYHNLVNSRDYYNDSWKYKTVVEWNADDTISWLSDCAVSHGFFEYDIPYYNFRIPGIDLRNLRREDFLDRMRLQTMDHYLSMKIADTVFEKLQCRLNDEIHRQTTVFRYAEESDFLDLDSLDNNKNRWNTHSETKPNIINLFQVDSSDDTEDAFGPPEAASPEFSYVSDGSKSSDEDEKRKLFKRPPGRPKGSGRRPIKRPKSVSVPEFLRNLLFDERYCPSIIKWEDYSQGKFR